MADVLNQTDEMRFADGVTRQICRHHARSFYFASRFLPQERRQAAYAIYAICRLLDDAVDNDENPFADLNGGAAADIPQRLARFRELIEATFAGRLSLPDFASRTKFHHALFAFAHTVKRYDVPQQPFLDLADGCEMDLSIMRYQTWPDLERYCYRVAGVVGLIMAKIFGLDDQGAASHAVTMGNAMQLTNILRDVHEDWGRGRVYVPLDEMQTHGYSLNDLENRVVNESFVRLMTFQIARARRMFREASGGLCHLSNDGSRLTACTMAVVYAGILAAIERQGYDVYSKRARLNLGQKLARLPRAWALSRRQQGQPLPHTF